MGERGPQAREAGETAANIRTGRTSPPSHLGKIARQEWKRIFRVLYDHGLVTTLDRALLAAYCQVYARWVQAEGELEEVGLTFKTEKGYVGQMPQVAIAQKAIDQLRAICQQLGLSASSRGRIVLPGAEEKEEDELLEGLG